MKVILNLNNFVSPSNEVSVYKGIPIKYFNLVKSLLNAKGYKGEYRMRFRGPRPVFLAAYCRKNDAKTFAVYKK